MRASWRGSSTTGSLLGGPLEGDRETLHVVDAPSEDVVRARFAADPWAESGMLTVKRVDRWTILLDGRGT
jgi:hypothetical protein